jgi:hypothetical protein
MVRTNLYSQYDISSQSGVAFLLSKFDNVVSYIDTNELVNKDTKVSDVYISEGEYDSSLINSIDNTNNDINLQATDYLKECDCILRIMDTLYSKLLLDKADYIILHSMDCKVMKLKNTKEPKSGKTVSVSISHIRKLLEEEKYRQSWYTVTNAVTNTIYYGLALGLIYIICR